MGRGGIEGGPGRGNHLSKGREVQICTAIHWRNWNQGGKCWKGQGLGGVKQDEDN